VRSSVIEATNAAFDARLTSSCLSCRHCEEASATGAVPHFFHGVVHLGLWVVGDGFFASGGRQRHPLLGLGALVITFLFLRSYLNSDVQAIVHAVVLVFFVPELLLFSYVNTIIFLQATTMGLKYGHGGRKDKFYTLSSLMITLPIMLAAWAEPLLCDKGLVRYGGHILFDYSIPLSSLAFFAVAHTMEPRKKIAAMAEGDDDLAKKQKAT